MTARLKEVDVFSFDCSGAIGCFSRCCRSAPNIWITPYDIIRMKRSLRLASDEFLKRFTTAVPAEKAGYHVLWLKLNDAQSCPFSLQGGCAVYNDRPWVCRMFPVVPVFIDDRPAPVVDWIDPSFELNRVDYCRGFDRGDGISVRQWRRRQGVLIYEKTNSEWKKVTRHKEFLSRDFLAGPDADLFNLCCYNIDEFRGKALRERLWTDMGMDEREFKKIQADADSLLKFSMKWLRRTLFKENRVETSEKD